jgi:hypothetical protein
MWRTRLPGPWGQHTLGVWESRAKVDVVKGEGQGRARSDCHLRERSGFAACLLPLLLVVALKRQIFRSVPLLSRSTVTCAKKKKCLHWRTMVPKGNTQFSLCLFCPFNQKPHCAKKFSSLVKLEVTQEKLRAFLTSQLWILKHGLADYKSLWASDKVLKEGGKKGDAFKVNRNLPSLNNCIFKKRHSFP